MVSVIRFCLLAGVEPTIGLPLMLVIVYHALLIRRARSALKERVERDMGLVFRPTIGAKPKTTKQSVVGRGDGG